MAVTLTLTRDEVSTLKELLASWRSVMEGQGNPSLAKELEDLRMKIQGQEGDSSR